MRNSKIEWTQHTFNPWWGCARISKACNNCYAEAFAKRVGQNVWGKKSERRFLSDSYWQQPLRWNAQAELAGVRERVFCASMADVAEDRRDLDAARARLWALIDATPQLDWLLVTKRPRALTRLVPWRERWPANVWVAVTVEHQLAAEQRLPFLTALPAAVRFISAEPLLGPLDLGPWIDSLDWVITGGETGHHARPSCPSWFTSLQQQCAAAEVAFHFKQWGDYGPCPLEGAGGRRSEVVADGTTMARLGKGAAGRLLGGRTWDELPTPRAV